MRAPTAMLVGVGVVLGLLGIVVALLCGFLWFCFGPNLEEDWDQRRQRFENVGEIGMAIVAAIDKYGLEHGAPPPSLEALVPRYLEQVPPTGLRDYPEFEYEVMLSSAWYYLGPSHKVRGRGLVEPLDVSDGYWIEPSTRGPPWNPVLVLTMTESCRVVGAWLDRMPLQHEQIEFSAEKWRDHEARIEMVRSLPKQVQLTGEHLSKVNGTLGEPDGVRFAETPWELRVNCPNGFLNWDVFVYWPTQAYPEYFHGGSPELIGKWAYVHE